MIIRLIISTLLMLNISICFAQNMSATFSLKSGEQKTLLPGDTFQGMIRIMPHNGENLERYKSMAGKDFIDYFYTVSIDSVALNPNNYDVLEIIGTFIVKGFFAKQEFFIWSHGAENLPVTIKGIRVLNESSDPKKEEKYTVVEQPYSSNFEMNWPMTLILIVTIALIGGIGSTFYLKARNKKIEAKRARDIVEYWNNLFINCSTRHDYEVIYRRRNEWLAVLDDTPPSVNHFFSVLENCQYKKEWDEVEESDVASSFDQIKGVFGQKYGI